MVRVILIDDMEEIRMLLRCMLDLEDDFEVLGEGCDGFEAIELAKRLNPDLIVLDLAMPRMDGLQACEIIKRDQPHIKIAILSGFTDQGLYQKNGGADIYLEKGTSVTDIIKKLRSIDY